MAGINRSGVTLIELIVAMAINSFLIGSVFFAWGYIGRHVAHQRRKSIFTVETTQITNRLASRLRQSPGICNHSYTSIAFIDPQTKDTTELIYYDGALHENEKPMTFLNSSTSLTEFTVEERLSTGCRKNERVYLVGFTFCTTFGDTAGITRLVTARKIPHTSILD